MDKLKEWTLLLYANGHNELEPEMWQSIVDIQNGFIGTNINVVAQISREEEHIVSLLRPDKILRDEEKRWSGVRRYTFSQEKNPEFFVLDNINMACPSALYDFISWGIDNFPAKKYILSISGHIYQFVGMCPDYSGDSPLMMGFPEISSCIQNVCTKHKIELSLLILDTCYASTVEIIYEIGRYENTLIKNVLTYIGKGPIEGLSYSNVISILDSIKSSSMKDILYRLVNEISINNKLYGLIAIQINHEMLELVKNLFAKLATTYLLCKKTYSVELTAEDLLLTYQDNYPWSLYLKPIHILLKKMIIATKYPENDNNNILPIHILYHQIPDNQRKKLYARLSFSHKNIWVTIIGVDDIKEMSYNHEKEFKPLQITNNILKAFVHSSNESLPSDTQIKIVSELIKQKNWKYL